MLYLLKDIFDDNTMTCVKFLKYLRSSIPVNGLYLNSQSHDDVLKSKLNRRTSIKLRPGESPDRPESPSRETDNRSAIEMVTGGCAVTLGFLPSSSVSLCQSVAPNQVEHHVVFR